MTKRWSRITDNLAHSCPVEPTVFSERLRIRVYKDEQRRDMGRSCALTHRIVASHKSPAEIGAAPLR